MSTRLAPALLLIALFTSLVATHDSQAQSSGGRWWRGESANFVVYGASAAQVQHAAEQLEDFDASLRLLLHVNAPPAPTKLDVYILNDQRTLRQIWPSVPDSVAGFYEATPAYVASVAAYDADFFDFRQTILLHEYAHHFMLRYFPNTYPKWYVEGFAEFFSTANVRDRRVTIGRVSPSRIPTLMNTALLPMQELLSAEAPAHAGDEWLDQFYADSWLAAAFIANRPERQQGLQHYIEALGHGAGPMEAFQPAFGISAVQFQQEMRAYLHGTTRLITFQLSPQPAAVTVTRLPTSFDDLLLPNVRILIDRVSVDQLPALVQSVETVATRFPSDNFAQTVATRVEMLNTDQSAARTRAQALVAANDNNPEAHYLLGMTYVHDAEAKTASPQQVDNAIHEARRQFVRAFHIDSNAFPTLYQYARTFGESENTPLTNDQLNVLFRALELAPQVWSIRAMLGEELISAQRYDDGVAVLRPLMYAPHDDAGSRRIRAIVAAAEHHQQPPPDSNSGDPATPPH